MEDWTIVRRFDQRVEVIPHYWEPGGPRVRALEQACHRFGRGGFEKLAGTNVTTAIWELIERMKTAAAERSPTR